MDKISFFNRFAFILKYEQKLFYFIKADDKEI